MSAIVYREPYKLPAGILAVAVHGAFFALLYFGFAWQTQPSGTMSVELWQSLPDAVEAPPARPRVEELALEPPPLSEKAAEPEVAPPQPEKAVEPEIVVPDEKAKAEKARIEKARVEKARAEKAMAEKAMAEKARAEKARAEKIAELAARERTEQAARERAEQAAAMGRVVDEYTGKIVSKIRRNIVMPPSVADDARAEFSVTLLPGGSVLSARLTKSSGNAAYDNAVERAILKSQPLPLPADAAMFNKFRELKLVFRPVE
ncbi:MAG: cell envelope integrity protein TolA [Gallionella sp.]|nr:cell envelope integrity protein TolA [Gallionella sp.]